MIDTLVVDTVSQMVHDSRTCRELFLSIGAVYAVLIVAITFLIKKIEGEGWKNDKKN